MADSGAAPSTQGPPGVGNGVSGFPAASPAAPPALPGMPPAMPPLPLPVSPAPAPVPGKAGAATTPAGTAASAGLVTPAPYVPGIAPVPGITPLPGSATSAPVVPMGTPFNTPGAAPAHAFATPPAGLPINLATPGSSIGTAGTPVPPPIQVSDPQHFASPPVQLSARRTASPRATVPMDHATAAASSSSMPTRQFQNQAAPAIAASAGSDHAHSHQHHHHHHHHRDDDDHHHVGRDAPHAKAGLHAAFGGRASSASWSALALTSASIAWADSAGRRVLVYASMLTLLALLEGTVALASESLALRAGGVYLMFDVGSYASTLALIATTHGRATLKYSYAFHRAEVLTAFAFTVYLLWTGLFLAVEGLETLLSNDPAPPIGVGGVFAALLACVAQVLGFLMLSPHARLHSEKYGGAASGAGTGVHPLLVSPVVLASVLSTSLFGISASDPLGAMFVAYAIWKTIVPLFRATSRIMLQSTPIQLQHRLDQCLREASILEGVLECRDAHFWSLAPGQYVGSLTVRVRSNANTQAVLAHVHNLFADSISHLTVQVEKDDWQLSSAAAGGVPIAAHGGAAAGSSHSHSHSGSGHSHHH